MVDKLTRLQGWETRFSDLILKYYDEPFVRGQNCCFLFISDVYEVMAGQSHIAKWRGKFKSKTKAMSLYFLNTGSTSFEKVFQWATPVENIMYAARGDIGMMIEDGVESLGVVAPNGRHFLCRCEDRHGLVAFPLDDKVRLWRIE